MPDNVWRGDAQAIAQVDKFLFAGTMTTADYYQVVINRKYCRLTIDATEHPTPAAAAAALYELLADFSEAEFREVTWSYTVGDAFVLGTAAEAGKPFTATVVASGGATGSLTPSTETASTGPYHANQATNWSAGTTPANGETIIWPADAPDCLYGLDFSAVAPAAIRAYSKNIGLPDRTGDGAVGGYVEYRPKVITFASCVDVKVGDPDFDSPDLVRIHIVATSGTVFVCNTGGGVVTDVAGPPVRFTSVATSGAGHTVYNLSGSVGLASGQDEAVRIANVYNGTYAQIDGTAGADDETATMHIGSGAVIVTAAFVNSGTVRCDAAVPALTIWSDATWSQRSGVPTAVTVEPNGTLDLRSGGTITAATFRGATFDLTGAVSAVTVTTLTALSAGENPSRVYDPHKRLKAGSTANIVTDRVTVAASDFGATFTLGFTA